MKKNFLLLAVCSSLLLGLSSNASADIIIGDAAADYVAAAGSSTTALTTLPPNWTYFQGTAALTPGAVGQDNETGFAGTSTAQTASVLGTNTNGVADFEIFGNGDANGAVVGTDLLVHPGNSAADFVQVTYTVPTADATLFPLGYAPGSFDITGSFRELIIGGGATADSVSAEVFVNGVSAFQVDGGTTASTLQQAEGTFTGAAGLTGLTLAAGDTIDFVVGFNGNLGSDETALIAQIEAGSAAVPEPSSLAILALGAFGFAVRRRR